jgi:group I intron endonuclease
MGYIYCITSPSGKRYIGQTKRHPHKRYKEHTKYYSGCIALLNAIKKYGETSMKMEILLQINDELLNEYEQKFIIHYNTLEPFGYNIRSGGNSSVFSDDSKNRMRIAKLGEKNHNYGKARSDEAKNAISLAKKGEKHHFYGKTLTVEHKTKLSVAHKKYDTELPMYIAYIKERPEYYQSSGYVVANHPTLKTKYFTSKKYTLEDKLKQAMEYIQTT